MHAVNKSVYYVAPGAKALCALGLAVSWRQGKREVGMFTSKVNPVSGKMEWVAQDTDPTSEDSDLSRELARSQYGDMLHDTIRVSNTVAAAESVIDIASPISESALLSGYRESSVCYEVKGQVTSCSGYWYWNGTALHDGGTSWSHKSNSCGGNVQFNRARAHPLSLVVNIQPFNFTLGKYMHVYMFILCTSDMSMPCRWCVQWYELRAR